SSTVFCDVLNPCNSALTRYSPGGMAGNAKAPTSLLCWVRSALVATFCAVTVAPGIVAPEASFTSPVMVPSVCAYAGIERHRQTTTPKIRLTMRGSLEGDEWHRSEVHTTARGATNPTDPRRAWTRALQHTQRVWNRFQDGRVVPPRPEVVNRPTGPFA